MNAIDFEVELRNIQVTGGKKIPDRRAVVRKDNGLVLGIVGNSYRPIHHKKVLEAFETVPFLKRNQVSICRDGAIMFAQFDICNGKKMQAEVAVGDVVSFGLRAFNSFNLQYGVGFELNANRLVCTNGLVVPKAIARLSMRHFQNVDTNKFEEIIRGKMQEFEPTIEIWKNWMKIKPSESRVEEFFKDINIGKRLGKQLWDESINEVKKLGVWGLFNTFTRYVSHDLKIRGDEANRMLSVRNKERELLHKFYNYNWN